MAGQVIPLLERVVFDFSSMGAGGSSVLVLSLPVDTSGYSEAILVSRLFKGSNIGAGASMTLALLIDGATEEDPAPTAYPFNFFGDTPASVAWDSTAVTPAIQIGAASAGFGARLRLMAQVSQANPVVTMQFVVSAEILLRE